MNALDEPPIDNEMNNDGGSIDPDDPLLIAQTLTYVTDNGSVVMSYSSSPFSLCEFHLVHCDSLLRYPMHHEVKIIQFRRRWQGVVYLLHRVIAISSHPCSETCPGCQYQNQCTSSNLSILITCSF